MTVFAHQLLHGYADGHRLLASSIDLPDQTARSLLIHSDAVPGPKGERTIGALPLPEVGLWALTATWGAPEMPRPGSVWSHTLLIDLPTVRSLSGAGGLLSALRRPDGSRDANNYRERVAIREEDLISEGGEVAGAEAVLLGFYAWPGRPSGVIVTSLHEGERALFAVWEQQWPELRFTTNFASRIQFDAEEKSTVQVALRGPKGRNTASVIDSREGSVTAVPAYVRELLLDIRAPGALRIFLASYGPELSPDRAAVRLLVETRRAFLDGRPDALQELVEAFPHPNHLSRLKFEAVSPGGSLWRVGEAAKVLAGISAARQIPLSGLELGSRLAKLWPHDPDALCIGFAAARRDSPAELAAEAFEAVAAVADTAMVARLAKFDLPSAVAVSERRPDLLTKPHFWRQPGVWREELLRTAKGVDQTAIVRALLMAEAYDLIGTAIDEGLLSAEMVGDRLGDVGFTEARDAYKKVFHGRMDRALASASREGATKAERVLAALSAPPRNRIISRYSRELSTNLNALDQASAVELACRLVTARPGGSWSRDVMKGAFPILHRALVEQRLDERQWKRLDRVLPPGNDWDRAERLRKALIESIKSDSWSESDIATTLRRAGPEADRVLDLVGKKSKVGKVIGDIVDALTFWA